MEWIPVTETLPPPDQEVLLLLALGPAPHTYAPILGFHTGTKYGGKFLSHNSGYDFMVTARVSHWLAFPYPPEEAD